MDECYDLVIFGGGTVGGAIFLDATSRGLKTALVEKFQIGHQTNKASLGLIQRDPKYLHTDVDLVFMNAVDCGMLRTIAEDFLKKQHIIIPHFSDSAYPLWLLDSYISALDKFASFSKSEIHKRLSRQELFFQEPFLRKDATGGILYEEWNTDPVELNSVFIKSAKELGGDVFEFFKPIRYVCRSTEKQKTIERVWIYREMDERLEELQVRYFINATGPWTPYFLKFFDIPPFQTRLTKGTSIVVNKKLSNNAVIVFNEQGKYITVLPQEGGKTLIGPTNQDVPDCITKNPDILLPSQYEIEELLKTASKFFNLQISSQNIVEIKCGLRPQLNHQSVKPDEITHEFVIIDHKERDNVSNLYSVFGGKLSNQIRMAKEAIDCISDLKWRIPKLRIKKDGKVEFENNESGIEKLYEKKFALSFKDKIGKVTFGKKIKSLFFVGYFVLKGLFHEILNFHLQKKGENHAK